MREIKFRLWHKKDKDMLYYNNDIVPKMTINGVLEEWIGHTSYKPHIPIYDNVSADYEIMQYTGLEDRNGKEIFEGDIVKMVYVGDIESLEEIRWETGSFISHVKGNPDDRILDEDYRSSTVIGNIYEHGNLLNK